MKTTVAIKIETTDSDFCYDCPALTNIESQFPSIYNFTFCRAFNQKLTIVSDLPEKGKWTTERCKDCIEYEKTQKDFVRKLSVERVIIRRTGDTMFQDGVLDMFATHDGKLAIVANRGFEIILVDHFIGDTSQLNSKKGLNNGKVQKTSGCD